MIPWTTLCNVKVGIAGIVHNCVGNCNHMWKGMGSLALEKPGNY